MPIFEPNKPIETTDPKIEVTVDPQNPLPVGLHRFQLIVEDDSGNQSEPAVVEVLVQDTQRPTAVLDAPRQVEAGSSFALAGDRSTDVPPGRVVKYIWSLVPVPERPIIDRPVTPVNPRPINPVTPINPNRPIDLTNPTIRPIDNPPRPNG